jgi:hypothetical protein
MPVILTTPYEVENLLRTRLSLPDGSLRIVACGVKEDYRGSSRQTGGSSTPRSDC